MTPEKIKKIYEDAGLEFVGYNQEGEQEFLGTIDEWKRADLYLEADMRTRDQVDLDLAKQKENDS